LAISDNHFASAIRPVGRRLAAIRYALWTTSIAAAVQISPQKRIRSIFCGK
jgi:hypothetical protein